MPAAVGGSDIESVFTQVDSTFRRLNSALMNQ